MKPPRGWTKTLLHHMAHVQTGLSKSESRQGPTEKRPYLRVANVQDGYLDLTQIKEIDVPVGQLERFLLQKDDIVLTEGGDFDKLGRGCVWKGQIPECVHQNHIFAVRVLDKSILIPQFLAYQMQSIYGRKYFLACAKQTTNLASINASQLKKFPILLPSYEVQNYIVDHLTTWDAAIEKIDMLIRMKEKSLKWFRQHVLTGKRRIAGYSAAKWKKVHMRDVLTEHKQLSSGMEEVCSVSLHKGVVNQIEHLGRVYAATNTSKYNLVKPGDIIYTKSPTGSFPYGIIKQSRLDRNVIVSPLYGVFTPLSVYLGAFLDCYFASDVSTGNYLRPIIHKGAKNTMNITNETFLSNTLYLPMDNREQEKIAEIINNAKQEIDLLKQQSETYRKQKNGLMQKLLSGEWRMKTAGEVS